MTLVSSAVSWAQTVTPPAASPSAVDAAALTDFGARIKAYVALRGKADDGAPPLARTTEPAKIKAAQDTLAERIRTAKAGAKRGGCKDAG